MRRRTRAASADAGCDGRGEQVWFFALRRARDDYGRQARDPVCQHKEQIECGRAVVFFYMNHGFALFKEINLRGVEDVTCRFVGPRLSFGSLSPASRGVLHARTTSWRLAKGLSRPAAPARAQSRGVAPQTSNCTSGVRLYSRKRVRATPCQCRNLRPSRGSDQSRRAHLWF